MKSLISLVVASAGLLNLANAQLPVAIKGCYTSTGGGKLNSTQAHNSKGICSEMCLPLQKPVMLLTAGTGCWCGDLLPNNATKVDDSKCNFPCPGTGAEFCGGLKDYYTVYTDGLYPVDPDEAPVSSSTSSSSSPTPSSTAGSHSNPAATTVVISTPINSSAQSSAPATKKSKPNVAAIAAGVVVGVVILAAIAGGIFFYMRNKKRHEIEEEHRRNAAINSAVKPPVSAGSSFNDTRLDPVVMSRRQSSGSIADNQDYSRRILKVTNA